MLVCSCPWTILHMMCILVLYTMRERIQYVIYQRYEVHTHDSHESRISQLSHNATYNLKHIINAAIIKYLNSKLKVF
jgi:hypothetical protein